MGKKVELEEFWIPKLYIKKTSAKKNKPTRVVLFYSFVR